MQLRSLLLLEQIQAPQTWKSPATAVSAGPQEKNNVVVFTDMQDFLSGLDLLHQESRKPKGEDEAPKASVEEQKTEDGGCTKMQDSGKDEPLLKEKEKTVALDDFFHEAADGKGLSKTYNRLKDRGYLKDSVESDGKKDIHIDRTDEYGRTLASREDYRLLSHAIHGKGPGKKNQEKRWRKYQEELKGKQMNAETPSLLMERARDIQAQLKTPYLVLSGNVKSGRNFKFKCQMCG